MSPIFSVWNIVTTNNVIKRIVVVSLIQLEMDTMLQQKLKKDYIMSRFNNLFNISFNKCAFKFIIVNHETQTETGLLTSSLSKVV
jgi:hypothetical protein